MYFTSMYQKVVNTKMGKLIKRSITRAPHYYANYEEVKTALMKQLKEQSTKFYALI